MQLGYANSYKRFHRLNAFPDIRKYAFDVFETLHAVLSDMLYVSISVSLYRRSARHSSRDINEPHKHQR